MYVILHVVLMCLLIQLGNYLCFNVESGTWTRIIAIGEGPSGRFSMAGDSLDPQMGGVLSFIGGCNKNLEALDDMYYLHTGSNILSF